MFYRYIFVLRCIHRNYICTLKCSVCTDKSLIGTYKCFVCTDKSSVGTYNNYLCTSIFYKCANID